MAARAIRAIPSALRRLRWGRLALRGAALFVALMAVGYAAAHLVPLPERLSRADSTIATYRDGELAHALLSEDDKWRFPTRLDDVDPAFVEALIAREDRRFRWHPGVDPIAIARAAFQNARAGGIESGGSTITMQLVRLLEPRPRTLRAKAIEALRAIQLELRMSKDEILEAYLRFAPYGGNLEGVEAASASYWGRSAAALSAAEIATLLAVPQNPEGRRPAPENEETLREARDRIALELAEDGAIPMAERPEALREALARADVPTTAGAPRRDLPHLVRWLRAEHASVTPREGARGDGAARIPTQLDRRAQRRAARVVRSHADRLRARGAPHAAVAAIEPETGRVAAVVGNLAFDPERPGTTLPAFAAPRSTGSLLKPVAYAAALDEGVLAPSHALLDVPIRRGEYRPQNFDRRFLGLVEAEEALSQSRNVPFVRLVDDLGVDAFVQAMVRFEQVGAARRAGHGGLELVVGGMPATPLEVASLYAGLARGGVAVEPALRRGGGADAGAPAASGDAAGGAAPAAAREGERAVSEAAAWLTTRALTRRLRPHAEAGPRRARDEAYAWKTGTSYAYHDAWTAGFGDRYAVAVWAGDLAHERHPELVGAGAAAPLFFDVIASIDQPVSVRAEKPADELAEIEVCALSGRRPGPHCDHKTRALAPARTAAPQTCDLHDEITVDAETGRRLPRGCRPDSVTERERRVVVRPPEELARFERARGRRAGTLPPVHPECAGERSSALAITSPREGDTVVLERGLPAWRQLVRLEGYSSSGSRLHWYVDGHYLESGDHDEAVYWEPEPGAVTFTAVDDRGNRDSLTVAIEGEAAAPGPP